ncbi:MAG: hypothetical protein ACJ743_08115 [Gaiellaceae bacterium]
MAKKGWKKTRPEEWARFRENRRRMEDLLIRALERDGVSREEAVRRVRPRVS